MGPCITRIGVQTRMNADSTTTATAASSSPTTTTTTSSNCNNKKTDSENLIRMDELQAALVQHPDDPEAAFALGLEELRQVVIATAAVTTTTPITTTGNDASVETTTSTTLSQQVAAAQKHLLQAAKLSQAQHANAFAALGYWYEFFGGGGGDDNAAKVQKIQTQKQNKQRAVGCYSKAIMMLNQNNSHAVAGRGLLRLAESSSLQSVLNKAIMNSSSSSSSDAGTTITTSSISNGWAWREMGRRHAMEQGDDTLAVVAYLRALRCSDILLEQQQQQQSSSSSSSLSSELSMTFLFAPPSGSIIISGINKEKAATLAELAACYRRLGRYTASIRSYHASIQEYRTKMEAAPASILCSCAQGKRAQNVLNSTCVELYVASSLSQFVLFYHIHVIINLVELELGLSDEAAEKFQEATTTTSNAQDMMSSNATTTWAVFGHGASLLAMARRDFNEGKMGSSFSLLQQSIDLCQSILSSSSSTSAAASKSSSTAFCKLLGDVYTFSAVLPTTLFAEESSLDTQLEFVAKGAAAYRQAEQMISNTSHDEEQQLQKAALLTDMGTNLLLRAQLLPTSDEELLQQASEAFQRALDISPLFAPAWCGFGCSIAKNDPLLAQHAFGRSIELDPQFPDSYSNLSLLLTQYHCLDASTQVLDALTQVADTPLNWINRALILEQQQPTLQNLQQAADAYKAALQVEQHPTAMLALALTHVWTSTGAKNEKVLQRRESYAYTSEYLGRERGVHDRSTAILNGLLSMDFGLLGFSRANHRVDECLSQAKDQVAAIHPTFNQSIGQDDWENSLLDQLLIDSNFSPIQAGCAVTYDDSLSQHVSPFPHEISLTRQIMHEPNRGDLWLGLAKELALRRQHKDASQQPQAIIATERAVSILQQQNKSRHTSASDLADAFALRHWLCSVIPDKACEQGNDGQSDEYDASLPPATDLQRSLLLQPNNWIARQALQQPSA